MADNNGMQGSLKTAVDSLSEQTKKIEIAKYYTHNNFDLAKQMVNGTYKDVFVMKVRFNSSTMMGAFIFFFNQIYMRVTDFFGIVTNSFAVEEIKTTVDWRVFEQGIRELLNQREHDDVLVNQMKDHMMGGFTVVYLTDLKKLLEQNDQIGVNHMIQKLSQTKLGFQNIKVSADFNRITSLDMELYSISSTKIREMDLHKEEQKAGEEGADIQAMEDDPLDGKEVRLILNGGLVLAPIKGKEISSLAVGDRIKVKIIDKNPKAIQLAEAFKAYENGEMRPIAGRIVSFKPRPKGGYKIFVIVAKGIFIRVDEEEEHIKVAMDEIEAVNAVIAKQEYNIPLIILVVMLTIGIVGAVVFFLIL